MYNGYIEIDDADTLSEAEFYAIEGDYGSLFDTYYDCYTDVGKDGFDCEYRDWYIDRWIWKSIRSENFGDYDDYELSIYSAEISKRRIRLLQEALDI